MVSRVIRIIEHLAQSWRNPTLADLARSTGLPKSSLHRILSMLAENGAVTRHGETYRLGDRLTSLIPMRGTGSAAELRRLLMPFLTDLYRRTGLIVGLAVLAMPDVVSLETIYGHQHHAAAMPLPERAPAHRTAAGILLLGLRPERLPEYEGYGDQERYAIGDQERFHRTLARVRASGVATTTRREAGIAMATAAVAVTDCNRQPAAALTVSGPGGTDDLRPATRELRQVAYAASVCVRQAVGGRMPAPAMAVTGRS